MSSATQDSPFGHAFTFPFSGALAEHIPCQVVSAMHKQMIRIRKEQSEIFRYSNFRFVGFFSILPLSDFIKRMDCRDLRGHEMDLMLSSALLSLKTKGTTI
jgi:hypothetical protein